MRPSDSECDTGNNNKFLNKSGHDDEAEESEWRMLQKAPAGESSRESSPHLL